MADIYSREKRSAIMSLVRKEGTRPERVVCSILRKLGVRYRQGASDLPGRPDIVLRARRVVVLVHGCYWHRHKCPKGKSTARTNAEFWANKLAANVRRDRANRRLLLSQGYNVVTVWE